MSTRKYHYTYRITNRITKMHYYGVRSCDILPKDDLGIIYFTSSSNYFLINEQKEFPDYFKYKIIKIFKTRKEALTLEVFLHKKFNVKDHESFYNLANQSSDGFDCSGHNKHPRNIHGKSIWHLIKQFQTPKNSIGYYNEKLKDMKIVKFNKFSPEVRKKYSDLRKQEYIDNPELLNRGPSNATKEERINRASSRKKEIILEDGTITNSYLEGARKGVNTRNDTIVEYNGEFMSIADRGTKIRTTEAKTTLVEYEGEIVSKSVAMSREAMKTMKTTMIIYEGKEMSVNDARILKMKKTKNKNKLLKRLKILFDKI